MNSKELREAERWAKQQAKEVRFDLPDRQPGEEPATQKQLQYIRALVRTIDETELAKLGKWQASALIDQIKSEKDTFTQEAVEEYVSGGAAIPHPVQRPTRTPSTPSDVFWGFVVIAVATVFILRFFAGSWSAVWELFR
jgi:hypothetical protein